MKGPIYHKNILHTTTHTKAKVKSQSLQDIVIQEGMSVLELFTSKNEALLVSTFLILDIVDCVWRLSLESSCLTHEDFNKYLYTTMETKD